METTDKDYIDAKLQAVIERLNGEARAHQVATDARFVQFSQVMESGFKSLQKDNEIHRAQTEAYLQKVVSEVTKSHGEIIKWVAAISTTCAALTISATALLVGQATPKTPAPIVIYAQPTAPAAAPASAKPQPGVASSLPRTPTAHAGQTLPASSPSTGGSALLAATHPAVRWTKTVR